MVVPSMLGCIEYDIRFLCMCILACFYFTSHDMHAKFNILTEYEHNRVYNTIIGSPMTIKILQT